MRKFIIICIIIIVMMLSACRDINNSKKQCSEISNYTPEQIIEYYFNAWNKKHYGKMNDVMSNELKAQTYNYESVKSIDVISCEQITVNKLPDKLKNLDKVEVYCVELAADIDAAEKKVVTLYYAGKKTDSSPWLIWEIQNISVTNGDA